MKKACFIDRDGVLIRDLDYLSEPERVQLLPGAVEAIHILRRHGFLAIVATNQSGVARGYFDETAVHAVHRRIDQSLARADVAVDAWYHCPHHTEGIPPFAADCDCRKPKPGMLRQAARDFNIDLSGSFIVGDKVSDLRAGLAAGCQTAILVKTGQGREQMNGELPPGAVVREDLKTAVEWFFTKAGFSRNPEDRGQKTK